MARLPRWTLPGGLHHVSQGAVILAFEDAYDFESYLHALSLSRRYVSIFNRRHGRRGTLWQGRFQAAPVAPATHALLCMRYIEQAPRHISWSSTLAEYPWSSASHHLGRQRKPWLVDLSPEADFWRLGNTPFEREVAYHRMLEEPLTPEQRKLVESTSLKGWTLGFAADDPVLAAYADRPLAPRRRGRPSKV
jgi:putative transposase